MKVLGEEDAWLLLIQDLDTSWGEWSASRPGRAYPRRKDPLVPILQEAEWAPEHVWIQRLEEKSLASTGNRTSISRSSSL